jgi:hypothetical protein
VSSFCRKLDTLHHWSAASPQAAAAAAAVEPATVHRGGNNTPHPRTAEPGERRLQHPHLMPGTGATATGSYAYAHTPSLHAHNGGGGGGFENWENNNSNSNSGGAVVGGFRRDLAPIRSHAGLSFAEVLARNSPAGTYAGFAATSPPTIALDPTLRIKK